MSVQASEIVFYKSTATVDGIGSLGGAITTNLLTDNLLHDLFDAVGTSEAEIGDEEYRCIYVRNTNTDPTTLTSVIFYILTQASASHPKNSIGIGIGSAAKNATEASIANESTAPGAPVVFTTLTGSSNGVALPDLNGDSGSGGDYQAIWIKRIIAADADSQASITATIAVQGDTT